MTKGVQGLMATRKEGSLSPSCFHPSYQTSDKSQVSVSQYTRKGFGLEKCFSDPYSVDWWQFKVQTSRMGFLILQRIFQSFSFQYIKNRFFV